MKAITKVLVANRGEIAVRIIRAAHDAEMQTVAIYADQDRNSGFVRLAHEAFALSGSDSESTYLSVEKIISIAKRSGADAVHPGYGFLAENADFAQRVIDEGITWVGPPPAAIRLLGDKVSARKIAEKVGAPLAPGTTEPVQSAEEIAVFAKAHGLPIAIKAAHGGGGRGLKVVHHFNQVSEQFASAKREALAAFGRDECFVEKYLEKPRHVETQCIADSQGKVIVVSTRDCSLQRRHQKLVEEAPAPFLSQAQEALLYEASKAILKEAGYMGAGTCEFLIGIDGTVSFLEVNTRIQVEHPVSEEVTGIDLVREQFRIASGGLLDYGDPVVTGHSIEFRVNGEDPGRGFLPVPGPVHSARFPAGPGVRVDSGITSGDVVTGAFDSLLAKIIVTGSSRREAIDRAQRVLDEVEITGLPTVVPFHRAVVRDPAFISETAEGFRVHTSWIETEFETNIEPWGGIVEEGFDSGDTYRTIVVEADGRRLKVGVPAGIFVAGANATLPKAPRRIQKLTTNSGAREGVIKSPMQATVVKVAVGIGDRVSKGDVICVLEAMKMEQPIVALQNGIVETLDVRVSETLSAGQLIATIGLPPADS